jgi:hypothetical protein
MRRKPLKTHDRTKAHIACFYLALHPWPSIPSLRAFHPPAGQPLREPSLSYDKGIAHRGIECCFLGLDLYVGDLSSRAIEAQTAGNMIWRPLGASFSLAGQLICSRVR